MANGNGNSTAANIGFEQTLWLAADKMRNNMDPAEYKHTVLGLIFLKDISDAFEEAYAAISAEELADPEDRDEYEALRVFWLPKEARWSNIQAQARQATIGKIIDDAMIAIEKENKALVGVLPKNYARPDLDKTRLGELVDLISSINVGDAESRSKDVLGRVYEYFLGRFASAEGKGGGEFYTPRCVVRLLVEMIQPYKGNRVYDPCCGSGGMFVQSESFVEAHGGTIGDISVFGQESNPTTWRLCKMNMAIRGIDINLGPTHADTFANDLHRNQKFDRILANPPFNISDWGGDKLREDVRWAFGVPPAGNANFAWVQHFIHHLGPNGVAGFVLANGSMSSNTSGEGEIRKNIIEADLVDCMVAMPGQLFYTTQIPVCLWFLSRNKKPANGRDRSGEILFIDARNMGTLVDRTHRELTDEDIKKISDTYHAWRGQAECGAYEDVAGFSKAVNVDEVRQHGYVLTPGRYVGIEEAEADGEPFDEKMARLTEQLAGQFAKSRELEAQIRDQLSSIGFGL